MKKDLKNMVVIFIVFFTLVFIFFIPNQKQVEKVEKPAIVITESEIILPKPNYESQTSLEEAILKRKSIREYKQEAVTLNELSQLLWAAQGITHEPLRSAPSAGGIYPIQIYVVTKNVSNIEEGVYLYISSSHSMIVKIKGNFTQDLQIAAFNQPWIGNAALNLVITGNYNKTISKYGERGVRYVHLEAGHVAQNIYLQAVALNLGTVSVGAFDDARVKNIIKADEQETPLYVMPVGRPK